MALAVQLGSLELRHSEGIEDRARLPNPRLDFSQKPSNPTRPLKSNLESIGLGVFNSTDIYLNSPLNLKAVEFKNLKDLQTSKPQIRRNSAALFSRKFQPTINFQSSK